MAERVGTGWAERYAHKDREWQYEPEKVRLAMLMRSSRRQAHLQNANGNAARASIERAAEEERRRNDPLEQAKAWLGTHLRVPVYAASVAGGPEDRIVVGRTLHSPEEVIEMPRAGAEREREKAARAPAPVVPAPAPQPLVIINKFASPSGGTIRSGQDDARGAVSRTPPVPEAAPHPDPADRVPPAIPAEPQPAAQEGPTDMPAASARIIERKISFRGRTQQLIDERADKFGITYGTAAAELVEAGARALNMEIPISDGDNSSAQEAPAPLPLESIALEALLAEIARRADNSADDEALGEAVARAEAAEGKLAQLRAARA